MDPQPDGLHCRSQDGLHRILTENFPAVSKQYRSADSIQKKLKETQTSLETLEQATRSTASVIFFHDHHSLDR